MLEVVSALRAIGLVVCASLAAGLLSMTQGAGAAGAPMVVVFPPWHHAPDVLASSLSAPVALVDTTRVGWMIIVAPQADTAQEHLRAAGAIAFLNADGAALCRSQASGA